MADTLESLELEIKYNATGAAGEIGKVTTSITNLKNSITRAIPQLEALATALKAINNPITINDNRGSNITQTVQKISSATKDAAKSTEPMSEGMQMLISGMTKYGVLLEKARMSEERMNEAFKNGDTEGALRAREQMLNAQAQAARELERMERDRQPAASPVSAPMQDMISHASEIDLLRMKIESLNASMQQAFSEGDQQKAASYRAQILSTEKALEKAQKAAEDAAKGVKDLSKEATKSKSPLGNLVASLKRVAFYRIIRGILKSISQAFTEGLQKAYIFSSGIEGEGHRFADALDSMKSSGNQLKGQLGAAFAALLTAIQPILTAIINLVIMAANAITQLLSAFTGSTYLKANAVAADFADNMAAGAGSAKEWKNQLLGFDEINRLNEPNKGGGGGGNPLDGYGFEDSPIDPKILEIAQKIKETILDITDKVKTVWQDFKDWWEDPTPQKFLKLLQDISNLITTISIAVNTFTFDAVLIPLGKFIDKLGETFGLDFRLEENLTSLRDNINALMTAIQDFVNDPSIKNLAKIWEQVAFALEDLIRIPVDIWFEGVAIKARLLDNIGEKLGLNWHLEEKVRSWKKAFDEFSLMEWFETKVAPWLSEDNWSRSVALAMGAFTGGFSLLYLFDPVKDWFDNTVAPWFTVEKWKELGTKAIQGIKDGLNSLSLPKFHFSWGVSSYTGSFFGKEISVSIPWPDLQFYKNGGFPEAGELFVANENGAGAELVGTVGGRTAVASNDDILMGIRDGVFEAVVAAFSQRTDSDSVVRVYLDGREIRNSQKRYERALGVNA